MLFYPDTADISFNYSIFVIICKHREKGYMKEFLKTNTVTYNLMSFTAFKSMIIFTLLLESPKSYKEIQAYIRNHEYIREELSIDALRIYLNSLREIGCDIKKINDSGVIKYSIENHPFLLSFSDAQVKSIIKVYKAISKSVDISDLAALQKFFIKISRHVKNEELKAKLANMSPLANIKPELIKDLINYSKNHTEITVYYNSPVSGRKNITILTDKVCTDNGKLYICGYNSEYQNYSKFLVSRIIKIVSVNINNKTVETPEITAGYQYTKEKGEIFVPEPNERIISESKNKITVEIKSKNKFELVQRIMFLSPKCKVLYPAEFKSDIISVLKKMKEGYFE